MARCKKCHYWLPDGDATPARCPGCGLPKPCSTFGPSHIPKHVRCIDAITGRKVSPALQFLGISTVLIAGLILVSSGKAGSSMAWTLAFIAGIGMIILANRESANPDLHLADNSNEGVLLKLENELGSQKDSLAAMKKLMEEEELRPSPLPERAERRRQLISQVVSLHTARIHSLEATIHARKGARIVHEIGGLLAEIPRTTGPADADRKGTALTKEIATLQRWLQDADSHTDNPAVSHVSSTARRIVRQKDEFIERARDRKVLLHIGGAAAMENLSLFDDLFQQDMMMEFEDLMPESAKFDEELVRIQTELRLLGSQPAAARRLSN